MKTVSARLDRTFSDVRECKDKITYVYQAPGFHQVRTKVQNGHLIFEAELKEARGVGGMGTVLDRMEHKIPPNFVIAQMKTEMDLECARVTVTFPRVVTV